MTKDEEIARLWKQIRLYESIIEGVCEALGVTPSGCTVVELDEMVLTLKAERDQLKALFPVTERTVLARLMDGFKDNLQKSGWTIKHSGVVYDHDPGDEHVYPDRWAP